MSETNENEQSRRSRHYAILSTIAATGGLVAIWAIGDTFGPPGTAAYTRYETFNRIMALLLVGQSLGLMSFVLTNRKRISPAVYVFAWAAILAWWAMGIGTAAEFFLFTDLAYGADNARDTAFAFFSTSSFFLLLALTALGISLLWRRRAPRWFAFGLVAYPIIDVALSAGDFSSFLAPSVIALFIAVSSVVGVEVD